MELTRQSDKEELSLHETDTLKSGWYSPLRDLLALLLLTSRSGEHIDIQPRHPRAVHTGQMDCTAEQTRTGGDTGGEADLYGGHGLTRLKEMTAI